jgi:hypothetical protein
MSDPQILDAATTLCPGCTYSDKTELVGDSWWCRRCGSWCEALTPPAPTPPAAQPASVKVRKQGKRFDPNPSMTAPGPVSEQPADQVTATQAPTEPPVSWEADCVFHLDWHGDTVEVEWYSQSADLSFRSPLLLETSTHRAGVWGIPIEAGALTMEIRAFALARFALEMQARAEAATPKPKRGRKAKEEP